MAKDNEKMIVQLASPERNYVKTYHDFLNNSFLSAEEQMIFIVLKSFIDFKDDSGEVFPSMETICKMAKMGEKRARKNIKSLEEKGIVKKIRRGLSKTNIYTIADYPVMWTCENVEDVAAIANNQGVKPMTAAEHIAELERMGYKVEIKEKGLEATAPTKVTADSSTQNYNSSKDNHSTNTKKNQGEVAERYPLDYLKESLCYNDMLLQSPYDKDMVDTFFHYLHEAMNTTKPTIRVNGEEKPREVVGSVLSKLEYFDFLYAVDKYKENTSKVNNQGAYIITLLYNAKSQSHADITNQVQHNMYGQD